MFQTVIRPASFVLVTVMLFGSGHLSSITLSTLVAAQRGFPDAIVGLLTSLPFFGLFAGAVILPRLLQRTRHVRLIALATAGCALTLLFINDIDSLLIWCLLRFAYGFCSAGVFMCTDIWMAQLSEPHLRGKTLAIYQMTILFGSGLGQLLLVTIGGNVDIGFSIATAVMIAAVIPVCCTKLAEPPVDTGGKSITLKNAWQLTRLSLVCAFISGLCFSNYGLVLLRLSSMGASANQIAFLGVLIVMSGIAGQFLIGYISDRYGDRRQIIKAVAIITLLALLALALTNTLLWSMTLVFGALYGAFLVTIYPLAVALAGDYTSKELFGPIAGKLFIAIMSGNALGPLFAGLFNELLPTVGTFIFISLALLVLIIACSSTRMLARQQPASVEDFAPMAPVGANPEMTDPRMNPDDDADAANSGRQE